MPTTVTPLRTLACPTCGAPLEIVENKPTLHCQYCNANVQNPSYQPLPAASRRAAPPARKAGGMAGLLGLVFTALIFLCIAAAGLMAYGVVSRGGAGNELPLQMPQVALFPLQIEGASLRLSSDGAPNLVATTYDCRFAHF
jgi:hypothetical protein